PQAPPRAKTKPWFRCHLISFRRFSRQRAFRPIAHLSGPHLTRSLPRLSLHRSRPRSSAKAPVGGLKPPPARRLRRSRKLLHLPIQHRRPGTPSPTPAHVHKVFSQGPGRWFEASSRKATPEVQTTPPSTHTAPEARHTKPHPRSCSQGLQPTQHVVVCSLPPRGRLRRAKPSSPAQHHVQKLYLQTELPSMFVAHVASQLRCHTAMP